jgi:hypothetical protein
MSLTKSQAYAQFAMWLKMYHPAVFAQLVSASSTLGRLQALYRGPSFSARQSQRFGDYADYFDIGSAASSIADVPSFSLDEIDVSAPALDEGPSLEQSVSDETALAASVQPSISEETALQTMQVPSVAESVPTMPTVTPTAAASNVGQTLANNAGLIQATLSAANTVVTSNAAAQLIQAQAQRAAAGLAPANVGYMTVTDPTTGAVSTIPVLNTGSGQLPLSTAGINQLSPATFLQNYGLYIMLGLAALVVAME